MGNTPKTGKIMKVNEICEHIENYIPKNRIDGTYIGDKDDIVKFICKTVKLGWHICVVGDLHNEHQMFSKNGIYYFATVTPEIKQRLSSLLYNNLEILYVFDERFSPMILIDDFPEDVTLNIVLCTQELQGVE